MIHRESHRLYVPWGGGTVTITYRKTVRVAPGKTVNTVNNVLWHG